MVLSRIKSKALACVCAAALACGLVPALAAYAADAPTSVEITIHKRSTAAAGSIENPSGEALSPGGEPGVALADARFGLYSIDTSRLDLVGAGTTRHQVVGQPTDLGTAGLVPNQITVQVKTQTKDASGNWEAPTGPTSMTLPVTETPLYTATTNAYGLINWKGVAAGPSTWYLLVETGTPAGHNKAANALIASLITKSDGNYNTNIHIYPKNVSTSDAITKEYADGTGPTRPVKAGDELQYKLVGKIAGTGVNSAADLKGTTDYGGFQIVDKSYGLLNATGDKGVDFVSANFVKADGSDGTTITAGLYGFKADGAGNTTFWLTKAGIDAAVNASAGDAVAVRLIVKGTVGTLSTNSADDAKGITNTAKFAVWPADGDTGDDPDDNNPISPAPVAPVTPGTDPKPAATLSVVVNKVIAGSTTPLEGAEFVIAKSATPGAVDYLQEDGSWGAKATALKSTTDASGVAQFTGVSGTTTITDAFTAYVIESNAPAGYQQKANPIVVDFKGVNANDSTTWSKAITVENYATDGNTGVDPSNPVFKLPLTGGMGTALFSVAGLLLIGGAIVLFVRYRKKTAKSE